jgi:hypothetical protein
MKRPLRVKIVGKQHTIVYAPTGHPELKNAEGDALSGAIHHDKQELYVEEGQPLEQEQDTVLHEVFHGVERAMDLDLEETTIRRMATGFLAVIKDNPSLVRYLATKTREIPQA